MEHFERVLVAVDFSDVNRVALERARHYAAQGGKIFLLHVVEHFPYEGPLDSAVPIGGGGVDALRGDAQSRLAELAREHGLDDAQQTVRVTASSARREILRFAADKAIDLIIVAPHGRGLLGSLGSTAMGVLNGALCDVLTVRGPDTEK